MAPATFTIQPLVSADEFPEWVGVEAAAFTGDLMDLMYPPNDPDALGPAESIAFTASSYAQTLATDPSARYCTAKLPSGKIIGIAKWNFFQSAEPQYPWGDTHPPGSNKQMIRWFHSEMDKSRERNTQDDKKHAMMAVLAILPEYQRMGVGSELLDWGIDKCDTEGLECWISASEKGKGLYLKKGWVMTENIEIDFGRWSGEEGKVAVAACMVRQPKIV